MAAKAAFVYGSRSASFGAGGSASVGSYLTGVSSFFVMIWRLPSLLRSTSTRPESSAGSCFAAILFFAFSCASLSAYSCLRRMTSGSSSESARSGSCFTRVAFGESAGSCFTCVRFEGETSSVSPKAASSASASALLFPFLKSFELLRRGIESATVLMPANWMQTGVHCL